MRSPLLPFLILLAGVVVRAQPWATTVLEYDPGSNPVPGYTDAAAALGRPTVDTYLDITSAVPDTVVSPFFPAWDFTELVSIGSGGWLELGFASPVLDDPHNLYGIDLLVFGNAMLHPLSGELFEEPGLVSVSQDGTNWYTFTDGPYADSALPTLGRVRLENGSWGDPTDPTRPPMPGLGADDLAGLSISGLLRRYRGGAGGTGFDLAELPLPVNADGLKWCLYVRISVTNTWSTEIDAVVDAAPADAWTRWQAAHFAWIEDPLLEQPDASPDGDDTRNWEEFGFATPPRTFAAVSPTLVVTALVDGLSFSLPEQAPLDHWHVEHSPDLIAPEWHPLPVQTNRVGNAVALRLAGGATNGVLRLRLEDPP